MLNETEIILLPAIKMFVCEISTNMENLASFIAMMHFCVVCVHYKHSYTEVYVTHDLICTSLTALVYGYVILQVRVAFSIIVGIKITNEHSTEILLLFNIRF